MSLLQAVVAIVVAIIGVVGASIGSVFAYMQFSVKRKDEKEEKDIQKRIDKAVDDAKEEMQKKFSIGLQERENTGKERFEINSKQIDKNTSQISEILEIVKGQTKRYDTLAESITALQEATISNSKVTKACAEGMRSTTYDRILIVANKALKRQKITITEKTNLKQLYNSWQELQGRDDKIETLYDDCMKLTPIPDEEG